LVARHGDEIEMQGGCCDGFVAGRMFGKKKEWKTASDFVLHLVVRRGAEEIFTLGIPAAEGGRHFVAHFIAAGSNRRAKGGQQITPAGAKDTDHLTHGFFHDPGERASPSRMNGGYNAMAWVGQKDRHAISRPDGKQNTRLIRQEGIALGQSAAGSGRSRITGGPILEFSSSPAHNLVNGGGVSLPHFGEGETPGAKLTEKPPPIFLNHSAPVAFNEAQIQPGGGRPARSSLARAEGVEHPTLAGEMRGLDPGQAVL
jgi:hypothetical protein